MSVKNSGNIDEKHFKHIAAALCNFYERHATDKSRQIEEVANSKNAHRTISVTQDVHTHAPFQATTLWFTFTMVDGDDDPEEFHVYVQHDLWPEVLFFQKVPNGDPEFAKLDPPPPGPPATSVGSYWTPLGEKDLNWF